MQTIRLSSGFDMPIIGLGTWQSMGEEFEKAIETALDVGYRHIDTAFTYHNEDAVGRALKKWFNKGGKREDLFITTKMKSTTHSVVVNFFKLPHYGNRPRDVEKFIKLSLERLQLDYVDMYLMHTPWAFIQDPDKYVPATNSDGTYKLDLDTTPVAVWKELEKQVEHGRIKSIGLSNFNESQIKEVWESAEIKPSNLQVELHVYQQQSSLRQLCKKYNITVTSYSSLASPGAESYFQTNFDYKHRFPNLLEHPIVEKIATAHRKKPAQVLLRHLVQHGIVVIPKSSNRLRIAENFQIFDFELTKDEITLLDSMDQGGKGRIFNFLFFKGVENHPYYPLKDELNQ